MTTRPVTQKKHCGYCGLTYFNDGHHAEVCTGPPAYPLCACGHRHDHHTDPGDPRKIGCWRCECAEYVGAVTPAFLSEPEYQREQVADDRDRRHEAYEDQRLTYPEKGLIE